VIGGKPIAVLLLSISGVSAINPLVAFYYIRGRKRQVLFFYFVPDTTGDKKKQLLTRLCTNDTKAIRTLLRAPSRGAERQILILYASTSISIKNTPARQVQVCNIKYVLDRVNRRNRYSMRNAASFVR
jgi:hypothetical protein